MHTLTKNESTAHISIDRNNIYNTTSATSVKHDEVYRNNYSGRKLIAQFVSIHLGFLSVILHDSLTTNIPNTSCVNSQTFSLTYSVLAWSKIYI